MVFSLLLEDIEYKHDSAPRVFVEGCGFSKGKIVRIFDSFVDIHCLVLVFLIYFYEKVFIPIYEKAKNVFDTEQLSRTIIAMAPYGLGLL